MSDDPMTDCPECAEASLKRKIGLGAGIIFKGGGFYETDFKEKKGSAPESSAKSESGSSNEATTSATAPTEKPAAKKDTPAKAATPAGS